MSFPFGQLLPWILTTSWKYGKGIETSSWRALTISWTALSPCGVKGASKCQSLWWWTLGLDSSLTLIHTCGPFWGSNSTSLNASTFFEGERKTFLPDKIQIIKYLNNNNNYICHITELVAPYCTKKGNNDGKVLPVSRMRCAGVAQYEVIYDTHIDVTRTPSLTVSHFNTAWMQNDDVSFF